MTNELEFQTITDALTVTDLRVWNREQGKLSVALKTLIRRRAQQGSFWLLYADDSVALVRKSDNSQGYTSNTYAYGSLGYRHAVNLFKATAG